MIGFKRGNSWIKFDGKEIFIEDKPCDITIGNYTIDVAIDFTIAPYNLDTRELAIWSTEECDIDCSYCYFKYFKSKLFNDKPISNEVNLEKTKDYILATLPDLVEFIGGEHSLNKEKILYVDRLLTELGAPSSTIIELDTNGVNLSTLEEILSKTKFVELVVSYESSDTDISYRGVSSSQIMSNIIKLHSVYKDRVKVRYLFKKSGKSNENDISTFKLHNIPLKESYLIHDINNNLDKSSLDDITSFIESDIGKLYYKAFNSVQSEIYGYGRSCLDTLIRGEGWDRVLHGCYVNSIINNDTSSIESDQRLNIKALETQRQNIYMEILKYPESALSGGCACLVPYINEESINNLDCSKVSYYNKNNTMDESIILTKILRAKQLEEIDKIEIITKLKSMTNQIYGQLDIMEKIKEPKIIAHVYLGANPPSVRTIQRYFRSLKIDVSSYEIKGKPFCFDESSLEMWKTNGGIAYIDSLDMINNYSDNDNLALYFTVNMTQVILIGKCSEIRKQITNGFTETSPGIYRRFIRRCIYGK